jgi:hypothetical protein
MPAKEYYFEQIEKEFAIAREAIRTGNAGKARVCARRAAGQAITWFLSKFPRPGWQPDALSQLQRLNSDESFPPTVRDAAQRLTTKISDRFTYPFSTNPIEDARVIIEYITSQMQSDAI